MTKTDFYKRLIRLVLPRGYRVLDASDWAERPTLQIALSGDPDYEANRAPILDIPLDNLQPKEGADLLGAEDLLLLEHPSFYKMVKFADSFATAVDNYLYGEMKQPKPEGEDSSYDLRDCITLVYIKSFQEIYDYEIIFTNVNSPGGERGRMRTSFSREEDAVLTGRAAAVFWYQCVVEH